MFVALTTVETREFDVKLEKLPLVAFTVPKFIISFKLTIGYCCVPPVEMFVPPLTANTPSWLTKEVASIETVFPDRS